MRFHSVAGFGLHREFLGRDLFSYKREVDMKKAFMAALILFCWVSVPALAQQYGPFTALSVDKQVVEDVFAQGNDIYVKINNQFQNATFSVKISNENKSHYRTWVNGQDEMQVKVYQSQKENRQGYTYRISTTAKYVEYWMDGKLVLHLERTS
jgi:hypothetical protein